MRKAYNAGRACTSRGWHMYLNSLEYLSAVAKTHSFTKAAQSIPISHQGLMKAIQNLEKELGLKLVKREGRQTRLTDEGAALMPEVEAVLEANRSLLEKASLLRAEELPHGERRPLFITPFIVAVLFPALPESLLEQWYANFIVLELADGEIPRRVAMEPNDSLAIICVAKGDAARFEKEGFTYEPLFSDGFSVAANGEVISPRKRKITMKSLLDLPLVCMSKPVFNKGVLRLFGGKRPDNIGAYTSGIKSILTMAAKGKAAVLTDTLVAYARRDDKDYSFFPLEAPTWGTVGLLYSTSIEEKSDLYEPVKLIREGIRSGLKPYIKQYPPS